VERKPWVYVRMRPVFYKEKVPGLSISVFFSLVLVKPSFAATQEREKWI
jgi:hypothetical protein